jgi:hypothetical protein
LEQILKNHLDKYYDSLIEYKHVASRINTIFLKDIEKYTLDDSILSLGSSLILRDWSGMTDNGWSYSYPTDSMIHTNKENYSDFLNDTISKQFCLLYAQSFEGLERLLKDLVFELIDIDLNLKVAVESRLKPDQKLSRNTIPSGDSLSKIINGLFDSFSYQKDNAKFDLKTSFFILSKTRNNIIHNNYTFSKSEIFCSTDKKNLFIEFFKYDKIDNQMNKIKLDINDFKKLMDFMCGYAFQVFKKLCLKYDLNWKVYKGMDGI